MVTLCHWTQETRDIWRSWSCISFNHTSHIWPGLCQKGVPVDRIVALLPYVDAGTIERTFSVHASGRVKKTRGMRRAVRMFPLGLQSCQEP